jgi:hypothetical protein
VNPPPCLRQRIGYATWAEAYAAAYWMCSSSKRYVGRDPEGRWVVAYLFHMMLMDGDE